MSWLNAQSAEAWALARYDGRAAVVRLPFPPTLNHAYRATVKRRRRDDKLIATTRKTDHAKAYDEEVWWHVRMQKAHRGFTGPVVMLACATPPDRRKRDVANLEKVLTDALVNAGVMLDDSQVHDMRLVWAGSAYGDIPTGEGVEVSVRELRPDELSLWHPSQPKQRRPRL